MINEKRLVNTFIELTSIDGISGNELEIANVLMQKLRSLNCKVFMDGAGDSFGGNSGNVLAYLDGNISAEPIFFSSHMDTIKSTKNIKHIITNGIIETDKTTILGGDDRSGLAIILEILEVIKENNLSHAPIEIIFTVCEEAGMNGSKFISKDSIKSKFGFVFDCQALPGNYIVEAPGAVSFNAVFKGKSAHAAVSPEKGINAIFIASKAISELQLGRWDETGMLNVGLITGGEAINVVPDKVEVIGETRNADEKSLEQQMNYIESTFQSAAKMFNGEVEVKFTHKYGGYKFTGQEKVIQIAAEAIGNSGIEPKPIKYSGGSDANVFNANGITALNLGVGFANAHSFDEKIAIKDLIKTAEIGLDIIKLISLSTN